MVRDIRAIDFVKTINDLGNLYVSFYRHTNPQDKREWKRLGEWKTKLTEDDDFFRFFLTEEDIKDWVIEMIDISSCGDESEDAQIDIFVF